MECTQIRPNGAESAFGGGESVFGDLIKLICCPMDLTARNIWFW